MTMEEVYIYSDESEARDLAEIFRRLFDGHYQHLGEDIVIAELGCGKGLILKHPSGDYLFCNDTEVSKVFEFNGFTIVNKGLTFDKPPLN